MSPGKVRMACFAPNLPRSELEELEKCKIHVFKIIRDLTRNQGFIGPIFLRENKPELNPAFLGLFSLKI